MLRTAVLRACPDPPRLGGTYPKTTQICDPMGRAGELEHGRWAGASAIGRNSAMTSGAHSSAETSLSTVAIGSIKLPAAGSPIGSIELRTAGSPTGNAVVQS